MHRNILLALFLLALPVQAAVFTVTKTADTLDGECGEHDCSLREAVSAANAPDLGGRINVVVIPAGIYRLTRAGAGEDANLAGDLDLNSQMIVVGAGAGSTILDGAGLDRVLDTRGPVEIFGVTIRSGRVDGDGGGLRVGGVSSSQPVLLHRCVVSGNLAQNGGSGGGIAVAGYLEVRDSAILENQAEGDGGGIGAGEVGTLRLRNVTVSGNLASGSGGGLDYHEEQVELISGSTIAFNEAHVSGGGIRARGTPLFPATSEHLSGSIVAGNTASQHPDCTSVWRISAGYNVFGTPGCNVETDRSGTLADPLIPVSGTLSGGFGPTPVHPLPAGSPALDMVAAPFCEAADQVGQARSAPCDAGAWELSANPVCIPGGSVLCLQEGRFRVTASWRTEGRNEDTPAQAVPLTGESGTFWFFAPDNLEIMVKVLNGCALNQRWWVFSSGLTNVGVTLRVEDLAGRRAKTYTLPPGTTYPPRLDTDALECSPALSDDELPAAAAVGLASRVLEVNKTTDSADGSCDHDCSLREAVLASEDQQGTNVIVLRQGDHLLSLAGAGENEGLTGDLDVTQDLVILGAGAKRTILDGGGIDRVLDVRSGGHLELYDVTVRGGRARPDPFFNAGDGGGIQTRFSSLKLVRSTVTANTAEDSGGGIASIDPLVMRDSTVSGNTALDSGGGLAAADVDLENVTISGNEAGDQGGGFLLYLDTASSMRNVTIAGNRAETGGGMAVIEPTCPFVCWGPFEMERTVIAGNSAGGEPLTADCFGSAPHVGAHNLFGIGGGCNPGLDDTAGSLGNPLDPRLTPLGDRGGPTPTHGLQADSPAVDLAPLNTCAFADQRGRPRPAASGCDAGAFERQPGCQPDEHTLCLGAGDRFQVTASHIGPGGALPLALDTGAFWFFEPDNLELTVKVLDGCGVNDRFWVFLSGLTDVRVDVRVEDTQTGEVWTHHHDPGTPLPPRLDTNALDVCQGS